MPSFSPFLDPPPKAEAGTLAVLHLKRDSLVPITLQDEADDGYAEGAVTNTRFGSFPHRTLIGLEWGSQVRASKVDTGTRGRRAQKAALEEKQRSLGVGKEALAAADKGVKRKGEAVEAELTVPTKRQKQDPREPRDREFKAPVEAGSGFLYILPPTPEAWTSSLDHRTQVVYTPDYSYVLQRLRVRPGSRMIEAGAGSGSFTHAAARSVFNGYPEVGQKDHCGGVYSFEYHEQRVQTLRQELSKHGLDGIVHLTHRDVCNDGFTLADGSLPGADAVFLDLPAPWTALQHLKRGEQSALNPDAPVHLCTFSPCIEQVMATTSTLRKSGWTDIEMVEVQHRRIDVRRERVGLKEEGLRGVNAVAATVEEALERHREFENKLAEFHRDKKSKAADEWQNYPDMEPQTQKISLKQQRHEQNRKQAGERKLFKEGTLVHRTESESKTHTSYLVFATLPREWSEQGEMAMLEKWPVGEAMKSVQDREARPASANGEASGNRRARKKGKVEIVEAGSTR